MKVIDLFCGCGGLSLGARKAGFEVAVSVDIDATLTSGYSINHPRSNLLRADVAGLDGKSLVDLCGGDIDGVVGGPPCQGFSEVGLAAPDDPRRALLGQFFRIVTEARPRFFLMENVRGLWFEKNRTELLIAMSVLKGQYEVLGPVILNAADFGAATSRPRVFIVGYDRLYVDAISVDQLKEGSRPPSTVSDAIGDLSQATAEAVATAGFDWWRYARDSLPSAYARKLRGNRRLFTGHRQVPHAEKVALRFATVPMGGKDVVGRHVRLDWDKQCPTLRAGTGPERGSFQSVRPLHPEENRVITIREAARLQGFPDGFVFHPTAWHSFRMIGNSVSPLAAELILRAIRKRLVGDWKSAEAA